MCVHICVYMCVSVCIPIHTHHHIYLKAARKGLGQGWRRWVAGLISSERAITLFLTNLSTLIPLRTGSERRAVAASVSPLSLHRPLALPQHPAAGAGQMGADNNSFTAITARQQRARVHCPFCILCVNNHRENDWSQYGWSEAREGGRGQSRSLREAERCGRRRNLQKQLGVIYLAAGGRLQRKEQSRWGCHWVWQGNPTSPSLTGGSHSGLPGAHCRLEASLTSGPPSEKNKEIGKQNLSLSNVDRLFGFQYRLLSVSWNWYWQHETWLPSVN